MNQTLLNKVEERKSRPKVAPEKRVHMRVDSVLSIQNLFQKDKLDLKNLTRHQKLTVLAISSVNFGAFLCFSIMAPFFTKEAAQKGVSLTVASLIFACHPFGIMISSPLYGKITPFVGAKFLFTAGMIVAGICTMLFGTLAYCPPGITFVALCFAVRSVQAFAVAAFQCATFVILVNEFPENAGLVFGFCETFVGLGMCVGPALGGVLYTWGGFEAPFYAVGGLMLLQTAFNFFVIRQLPDYHDKDSGSVFSLLKIGPVWIVTFCISMSGGVWSALEPNLEPHLEKYNITPQDTGFLFLLMAALYGIMSPVAGKLSDKFAHGGFFMSTGMFIVGLSVLLVGPSPILHVEWTLWLNIFVMALNGLGTALVVVPSFTTLMDAAINAGMADDLLTYSIVSGWWSTAYGLGDFGGATISGFLVEAVGFETAFSYFAIACLVVGILIMLLELNLMRLKRRESIEEEIAITESNLQARSYQTISYTESKGEDEDIF